MAFPAVALWIREPRPGEGERRVAAAAGGWVYDLTGSYNAAFTGAGAALVAAVVLVNRLGAYAYPVEREAGLDFAVEPAAVPTSGGERA